MKRIPALETVAGVAFFNELISKTIRMASLSGTRSLETRVNTCGNSAVKELRQTLNAALPRRATSLFLPSCPYPSSTTISVLAKRYPTHLVVIHYCVHRLDPNGINVPVENHPLVRLVFVETLHKVTQVGKGGIMLCHLNVRMPRAHT